MSNVDTKSRIVAFLTKQGGWYHISEKQKVGAPDFDDALSELIAAGRVELIYVNDRPYHRVVPNTPDA